MKWIVSLVLSLAACGLGLLGFCARESTPAKPKPAYKFTSSPTVRKVIVVPPARCLLSAAGDVIDFATPGDFDGDGHVDLAVKHGEVDGKWTYDGSKNGFSRLPWEHTFGGSWCQPTTTAMA